MQGIPERVSLAQKLKVWFADCSVQTNSLNEYEKDFLLCSALA